MSVERMIDTYVEYLLDEDTWTMFYKMRCHNLISEKNWRKFSDTCKGWAITEDGEHIIDTDNQEKIVYTRDVYGFYVKVA